MRIPARWWGAVVWLLAGCHLRAATVIQIGETGVAYPVVDFGAVHLQDRISGANAGVGYWVEVSLKISPAAGFDMFAADYLVTLSHNTGSSMTDPVGSYLSVKLFEDLGAAADPLAFGSMANGIQVVLRDDAPSSLSGFSDFTSTAPLTGDWRAYNALAPLGQMDPNGVWGLFVSDTSIGGAGVVTEWTVKLKEVPEPVFTPGVWMAVGAVFFRRRRRRG